MDPSANGAPVGVGLLGLGVVGSAVAASLTSADARQRGIRLCAALVRDPSRKRAVEYQLVIIKRDTLVLKPDRQRVVGK